MSKLFIEDTSLFAIGDAIREKTGKEDLLTLEQMPEEIRGISGRDSEEGFNLTPYISGPPVISDDIIEVTEDIVLHMERVSSVSNIASGVTWGCKKITLYISNKCTSFFRAFRLGNSAQCKLREFEIIGDTSSVTNYNAAFDAKGSLERIVGTFDFSSITSSSGTGSMLYRCYNLQEIRFAANTLSFSISISDSSLLSDESIQSIIDGLADLTDETTQTLTLHKDVKAKLTETQIATITNKNWTLA